MLSFAAFRNGKPAPDVNVGGAYLLGGDDVPLRADLAVRNGIIQCNKRGAGPAGLALPWPLKGAGTLMLETVRVPERERPYILTVELARGRLMRINQKLEEWALFEHADGAAVESKLADAKELLIRALQAEDRAEASALGDDALAASVVVGEEMARVHAKVLLDRRRQSGAFARRIFGATVNVEKTSDAYRNRLTSGCDFASLPLSWRQIEPREQEFNWKPLDTWVEYLSKKRIPMKGSSLLSFCEGDVPDWLYIWEHDFETIRDLAFEHIKRVLARYGQYIQVWDVVHGLHAQSAFAFTFEQLMELTRMAAAAIRQAAPRALSIINLVTPWGEYYARNQRTIPPMLYADMILQGGVNFDAFGAQFTFGAERDGMYPRDMFQISAMLDLLGKLGKPIHLTGVQVPSAPTKAKSQEEPPPVLAEPGGAASPTGPGGWHGAWSPKVQADWLREFGTVGLSKPFVETLCWGGLCDDEASVLPSGGLLKDNLTVKPAYEVLSQLRSEIGSAARRSTQR
jgi:GH35 family endo-1,4-beta-xylanase